MASSSSRPRPVRPEQPSTPVRPSSPLIGTRTTRDRQFVPWSSQYLPTRVRPFRLELRDVDGRWHFAGSYSKARNAGNVNVYDRASFGLRVIDSRTGRVVVAYSGRADARERVAA